MGIINRLRGSDDPETDTDADEQTEEQDTDSIPDVEQSDPEYDPEEIAVPDDEVGDIDLAKFDPGRGQVLDNVVRLHKEFIAPTEYHPGREEVQSGNEWVTSMYVNEWPSVARPGFLEAAFADATFKTDISIHLEPRDREQVKSELNDKIDELEDEIAKLERKGGKTGSIRDMREKKKDAVNLYDQVSQTNMSVFDTSLYVNNRGQDQEQVINSRDSVMNLLESSPANTDVRTAARLQDEGMLSASPAGKDELGRKNTMMAGAAGAMFPFSSSTMIEEGGIDIGVQHYNGSPVIVDRFSREKGYNVLTIGDIGSGKSFSTKLQLLRLMMHRDDVNIVMLDPLEGFYGVTEALDGRSITVGGRKGLNPLEIKETPQHVVDRNDGLNPYTQKLDEVMAFFDAYFNIRGTDLGRERGILEKAVKLAYEKQEITSDVTTHSNPSPTIGDHYDDRASVLGIIRDMADNPKDYRETESSEIEVNDIEQYASDLLIGLQQFKEGGKFENLSRETEFNIGENRVTYLDLQQQEGHGGKSLMMQLLFNAVYEHAKESNKKTVFVIDEAKYLLRNNDNLEFLNQAVRHSRHHNLSIQFVSQTVEEFFQEGNKTKAIADNCSMIQLNALSNLDPELARENLGLNSRQIRYVRDAQAGEEGRDFSEALVGVEGAWYPIHIKASDDEKVVIDYKPDEQTPDDLPGKDELQQERQKKLWKAIDTQFEKESLAEDAREQLDELDEEELKDLIVSGDFSKLDLDELAEEGAQTTAVETDDGEIEETTTGSLSAEDESDESAWSQNTVEEAKRLNTSLYHVRVVVDEDHELEVRDDDETPILRELDEAVTVIATDPPEMALRAGDYETGFDAIVGADIAQDELSRSLAKLGKVSEVTATDVKDTVDWNEEGTGISTDVLESAQEDRDAAESLFQDLKDELSIAEFEEIQEDINDLEFDETGVDNSEEIPVTDLVDDEFVFGDDENSENDADETLENASEDGATDETEGEQSENSGESEPEDPSSDTE